MPNKAQNQTMTDPKAVYGRIPWPPIIYVAAIAAGTALSLLVPLPWFGSPMADLLFAVGCIMIAAVAALYISAVRGLQRALTPITHGRPAEHLVTGGAFALSRNPIYLANTMLMIAVGLIGGWIWFLVLALAAAIVTQVVAIRAEERHLTTRFGKKYIDYTKKVRRWI